MSVLTDEARELMRQINSNLTHSKKGNSATRYFGYDKEKGKVVEKERSSAVIAHSMFPVPSTAMCVPPEEIPQTLEHLHKHGLHPDFDETGRLIIESTKQQDAVSKALGMKTGRDGYGYVDQPGRFQNTGRRRADEIREGRARVRKTIEKLNSMPEEVPVGAVADVLDEYDIGPTEENTG